MRVKPFAAALSAMLTAASALAAGLGPVDVVLILNTHDDRSMAATVTNDTFLFIVNVFLLCV